MATKAIAADPLAALYRDRFETMGLDRRDEVWRILTASFFNKLVPPDASVLELACGYGEFINNIRAGTKLAVDINADAALHLAPDVALFQISAAGTLPIVGGSLDVVFTSSFLEHLRSSEELAAVLRNAHRVLKPGGRFIVMGPNIRFAYREYWDFIDHHLPLSDRSIAEALRAAGFGIERNVPRFLPFSMGGRLPAWGPLIRTYLRMPLLWRLFGKQFLVIGRKP